MNLATGTATDPPASSAAPPPRPGQGKMLARVLLALASVLLILCALGSWLLLTESGARATFSLAARISANAVSASAVTGRLAGPLRVGQLRIDSVAQTILLQDLALDWAPQELWSRRLHVRELRATSLTLVLKTDAPKKTAGMPATLALPLAIAIDRVSLGGGSVSYGATKLLQLGQLSARLGFDGRQYSVALERLALRQAGTATETQGKAAPATQATTAPRSAPAQAKATATTPATAPTSTTAGTTATAPALQHRNAAPTQSAPPATIAGAAPGGNPATTATSNNTTALPKKQAQPTGPASLAGEFSGALTLGAEKPFAIAAAISSGARASLSQRQLGAQGQLQLSGDLEKLLAGADISLTQATASATLRGQAELHPFAAQPLGAASLTLSGLDLSALDAGLPRTTLAAALSLDADGAGTLSLDNGSAGPWDQHLLPITSARLRLSRHGGKVDAKPGPQAAGKTGNQQEGQRTADDGAQNRLDFAAITINLGSKARAGGQISGSGSLNGAALRLKLLASGLDAQSLAGNLRRTALSGQADIRSDGGRQEIKLSLSEILPLQHANKTAATLALEAGVVLSGQTLELQRVRLTLGAASADLAGQLGLDQHQAFHFEGGLHRLRLQDLGQFADLPPLTLNGRFSASGERAPTLGAKLDFQISDSQVSGQPLSGGGSVELRGQRLLVPKLALRAGANHFDAEGALSDVAKTAGQLRFDLDAPDLALLGRQFAGALTLNGTLRGNLQRAQAELNWRAAGLRLPAGMRLDSTRGHAVLALDRSLPLLIDSATLDGSAGGLQIGQDGALQTLDTLALQLQFGARPAAPLKLALDLRGLSAGALKSRRILVAADGTTGSHALSVNASENAQQWQLKAAGGLSDLNQAPLWQGQITDFRAEGRFAAALTAPASLQVSARRVRLERLRIAAGTAVLEVGEFLRDAAGIVTSGRLQHFNVGAALAAAGLSAPGSGPGNDSPRAGPAARDGEGSSGAAGSAVLPLDSDLVLDGQWNLRLARPAAGGIQGSASLRRLQGDITMRGDTPVALGLTRLEAALRAQDGKLTLRLDVEGSKLGHVDAAGSVSMGSSADGGIALAPDGPVSGTANVDIPSIAWIGALVSPTLAAEGKLRSAIALGGTLRTPQLSGQVSGTGLRLYFAELGIDLRGGVLESSFHDTGLTLKKLEFTSAAGRLSLSGPLDFTNGKPAARLVLSASHYPLLNRPDRKLTLGGNTSIVLAQGKAAVTGAFSVESGFIDIGREGAPQLSDDVVVAGREKKAGGQLAAALDVRIDLGPGVTLQGRGLDAVLNGEIRLLSGAGEGLSATGALNVSKGTFTAYGRALAIEQGLLRFTGPLNNPALNILAMRRGQEVEAGVSVRGTVLAPRITLVSEPNVADAEKLSWLVLGTRLNAAGGGDMAALQSAAGSLLAGGAGSGMQSQLATAFGLDTLSVGQSQDSLQQRVITLGKKLSSRLYVSYQQGLQSASSAVLLRYTLSPRLTVEAEAGTISVLSLLYNIAFD